MSRTITDDLDLLVDSLAPHIGDPIRLRPDKHELLEVVMDLGRLPEARFPGREVALSEREVTESDIEYVVSRISEFGVASARFAIAENAAPTSPSVRPSPFASGKIGFSAPNVSSSDAPLRKDAAANTSVNLPASAALAPYAVSAAVRLFAVAGTSAMRALASFAACSSTPKLFFGSNLMADSRPCRTCCIRCERSRRRQVY